MNKCSSCNLDFPTSRALADHDRDRHRSSVKIAFGSENLKEFMRIRGEFICPAIGCNDRAYVSGKAFRKHMRAMHKDGLPVDVDDVSVVTLNDIWGSTVFENVEDGRALDTLTHVLRWEKTIPISKRLERMEYVERVEGEDYLHALYELLDELCRKWTRCAQGLNEFTRRKMVIHAELKFGWKSVEPQSILEYARTLFRLIVFLYRVCSEDQDAMDMPLELKEAVLRLDEEISESVVCGIMRQVVCMKLKEHYVEARMCIFWFVLLNSCDLETMGFRSGNVIGKGLSHLQYCFRAFVGYQISLAEDDTAGNDTLLDFLNVTKTNVMGFLRVYACQVRGITGGRAPLCQIQTFAEHEGCVISIGGTRVGVDDLKNLCSRLMKQANKLVDGMFKMCNADLSSVKLPTHFTDDLQETKVNYGLPNLPGLSELTMILIQGSAMLMKKDENKRKFMKDSEHLLEIIFVLHHVLSGMPSRGSEYCGLVFRTTAHACRSIFGHDRGFMVVPAYSKTTGSFSRGKVVCRFLPHELSKLMVYALVMIRPVMVLIAMKQNASASVLEGYRYRIYVKDFYRVKKVAWDHKAACIIFERVLKKMINIPLKLGQYRHAAEYFVSKFITSKEDKFEWFAMQSGHSLATSRLIYAASDRDARFIRSDEILLFEYCSRQWQSFIKGGEVNARVAASIAAGHRKIKIVHEVVHNEVAVKSWSGVEKHNVTTVDMEVAFDSLKAIIGDSARFKSVEQASAMSTILKCEESAFIVLPTGGGKTWTYAVPAMLDSRVTIVVLPLVSMLVSYRMIPGYEKYYCTWKAGMDANSVPADCRILLVSSGFVSMTAFEYVSFDLCNRGRLRCCVLDEAHMVVTESNYRNDVGNLFGLGRLRLPWYLLSGTVPCGSFVNEITDRLCVYDIRLIRAPTCRSDLGWIVKRVSDIDEEVQVQINAFLEMNATDLVLVYYNTKDDVNRASNTLQAAKFHSKLSADEKLEEFSRWTLGKSRVMCSTTACSAGMDVLNVRLVIQVDAPYSLVSLVQQGGRAGRDGNGGKVMCIVGKSPVTRLDVSLKRYLQSNTCRFQVLSDVFDGRLDACYTMSSNTGGCDACDTVGSSIVQGEENFDDFVDWGEFLTQEASQNIGSSSSLTPGKNKSSQCAAVEATPAKRLKVFSSVSPAIEDVKRVEHSKNIVQMQQQVLDYVLNQPWDDANRCWLCIVRNIKCENGGVKICKLPNSCLKCLGSGHDASKCKNRLKWSQVCFKCQLPSIVTIGDENLHAHNYDKYGWKCEYKLQAAQVSWYFWRVKQDFVLKVIGKKVGDTEFANWLQQRKYGILNATRLLVECYQKHSNVK